MIPYIYQFGISFNMPSGFLLKDWLWRKWGHSYDNCIFYTGFRLTGIRLDIIWSHIE